MIPAKTAVNTKRFILGSSVLNTVSPTAWRLFAKDSLKAGKKYPADQKKNAHGLFDTQNWFLLFNNKAGFSIRLVT